MEEKLLVKLTTM